MRGILFLIEKTLEGGYTARAREESIITKAGDLASLHQHQQVRDDVHFIR